MKRKHLFSFGIIIIMLTSGCNSFINGAVSSSSIAGDNSLISSGSSSSTQSIASSQTISVSASEAPSSTETTSTSEVPSISSISQESLVDTELSYLSTSTDYGNTNGNANNHGQVVYDRINNLHYFAIGPTVYSYKPSTQETTVLFTASGSGSIHELCLTSTDLYYVASSDTFMYRYNFSTQENSVVYENETRFLARYSNNIYMDLTKLDYENNPIQGLGVYRHSSKTLATNFSASVTNVNVTGLRLFYTTNNGPTVQLMADTFMGKTNVKSFSEMGFTEISKMHLISESYVASNHYELALLAKVGGVTNLYLYNTYTEALTTISSGDAITGINSNGTHIFFIKDSQLYRYVIATSTLEMVKNLDQTVKNLYVINHWLYFGNETYTTLFRLHPDTLLIETGFWLS